LRCDQHRTPYRPFCSESFSESHDWNEWGYLRLAFVNHRIPIRVAEVRAAPEGEWRPLKRSGGAWDILDGPVPDDGDGVVFRLTSAQGEVIEGTTVIPFLDESALSRRFDTWEETRHRSKPRVPTRGTPT
jgi:hypothetical protein